VGSWKSTIDSDGQAENGEMDTVAGMWVVGAEIVLMARAVHKQIPTDSNRTLSSHSKLEQPNRRVRV